MNGRTVILADDHPVFRIGIREVVSSMPGYTVVGEAGNGRTCVTMIETLQPDLAVIDLAMPELDGYGVLQHLQRVGSRTGAIIVSMHSSNRFAQRARELGARAFIAKEDAAIELANGLEVPEGGFYLSSSVGGVSASLQPPGDEAAALIDALTPAERRVFELVGQSLTSREIGEQLNLSHRTVQTHRQNMALKLGLSGPNKLFELAVRWIGRQT